MCELTRLLQLHMRHGKQLHRRRRHWLQTSVSDCPMCLDGGGGGSGSGSGGGGVDEAEEVDGEDNNIDAIAGDG